MISGRVYYVKGEEGSGGFSYDAKVPCIYVYGYVSIKFYYKQNMAKQLDLFGNNIHAHVGS